jgi:hypothetical protein
MAPRAIFEADAAILTVPSRKGGKAPRPDDTIAEPAIRFSCPAILSLIARLRAPRFGCQQIGCERIFLCRPLAETENRSQQTGHPENTG